MNQTLHVNKTNFYMKGFVQGLALKQRRNATRKSPISRLQRENEQTGVFQQFDVVAAVVVVVAVKLHISRYYQKLCASYFYKTVVSFMSEKEGTESAGSPTRLLTLTQCVYNLIKHDCLL